MWSPSVQSSFIITFIGDDRPGLVEELSSVITAQGGNWQESRLSQLAGKFAGLIQVKLPSAKAHDLQQGLKALHEKGLSVRVTAALDPTATGSGNRQIRLAILGPDRPGIVREIAAALAAQSVNVLDLQSNVSSAPMSAELIFTASVEAAIPDNIDLAELEESLDRIEHQMDVDIVLETD
jgi:glycine cleavage system regulatory protein